MSLDEKLNAYQIVTEAGMSIRPEFYSGRGAIRDDLNSEKLEKIYSLIESNHGKKPAKNFVQMVADIPVLSATNFLLSLYRLETRDWKWDKKSLGDEKGLYAGDLGTVMSALHFERLDEIEYIRDSFLRNHGLKLKKKKCYI